MNVTFSNYRCLRETKLRLGPLTILVGPNACGKTTICRALGWNASIQATDVWQQRSNLSVRVSRAWPGRCTWTSDFFPGLGHQLSGTGDQYSTQYLHLDANVLRSSNTVAEQPRLSPRGENLTSVFASFDRRTQEQLVKLYTSLVPVFADVHAKPLHSGQMRLRFQDKWNPECWFEPEDVSDGSVLALALLTLQFQPSPPDIVIIEDPERGLHPYLLNNVLNLLRRIANGEGAGRKSLIVLTTHSAELLNFARPDEVRFLVRGDDGSVDIKEAPTSEPNWSAAYEEYQRSLGGMWLSGSLGGVP